MTGRPSTEGDGFIQHPGVSRGQDVAGRRQRQPEVVVRAVRTHAPARWRMPPMLDVSLWELTGRAAEQVLAQELRLGVDERHRILQLIAETEGAPRLVVSGPGPDAARQSLVQEPAVGQHVQGRVRGLHADRAERVVPVLPHRFERAARRVGSPEAIGQVAGVIGVSPAPSLKTSSRSGRRPARMEPGSRRRDPGPPRPCPRGCDRVMAAGFRSVPLRPRNSVRSQLNVRVASSTSKKATRPANSVLYGIPREERSGLGVDLGDDVHGRLRPQISDHPFHVSGDGEPAGPARFVPHLHHHELDRRIQGHVDPELRADPALRVLEDAVAESVSADVNPGCRGRAAASGTRNGRSPRPGCRKPHRWSR